MPCKSHTSTTLDNHSLYGILKRGRNFANLSGPAATAATVVVVSAVFAQLTDGRAGRVELSGAGGDGGPFPYLLWMEEYWRESESGKCTDGGEKERRALLIENVKN